MQKQKQEAYYIIEGAYDREGSYWTQDAYQYTKNKKDAGKFTIEQMSRFNLDGCRLWLAERFF